MIKEPTKAELMVYGRRVKPAKRYIGGLKIFGSFDISEQVGVGYPTRVMPFCKLIKVNKIVAKISLNAKVSPKLIYTLSPSEVLLNSDFFTVKVKELKKQKNLAFPEKELSINFYKTSPNPVPADINYGTVYDNKEPLFPHNKQEEKMVHDILR